MSLIVTCPRCGHKFPAIAGEINICPRCGEKYYLERKFYYDTSCRDYEMAMEEYSIRLSVRNYIRDHIDKKLEKIHEDLDGLLIKKGFPLSIIDDEYFYVLEEMKRKKLLDAVNSK